MAVHTSEAYKAAVRQPSRIWRTNLLIVPDSGEALRLTEADLTLGSLVFEEASVCSDMLDVGSTYSNSLSFSLQNPFGRFDETSFAYAWVTASVGLQIGEEESGAPIWEDIDLGQFRVQEEGKKMSTIPLKCLDRMVLLGEPFSKLPLLAEDTPLNILMKMANIYGVVVENETQELLTTLTKALEASVLPEKMTCRDFVGYCAAFFGQSARFNRKGRLEFFRNRAGEEGRAVTTPDTRLDNFTFTDSPIRITGATIKDAYGETVQIGTDDYLALVEENPLLTGDELTNAAAQNIFEALSGVTYTKFQTGIIGDPSIQAGDPVRHENLQGGEGHLDSIITHHRFQFRGGGSLEAKGEAAQTDRQLTSTAKKLVETQRRAKEDLNDAVSGMEKALLNQTELITNSLGFYTDCIRDEETGAVLEYRLQDKPKGQNPRVIWRITSEGIQMSNDGGETWTFGVDSSSSIIAQIVTADMIRTGVMNSLDDSITLDLEKGVFRNRTETGYSELNGHEILLHTHDKRLGEDIAYVRISADNEQSDDAADMRLDFYSADGHLLSGISQHFTYNTQTGQPVTVSPLTVTDLRVQSQLTVTDSLVYDHMLIQRKSGEEGNTGVDFVITGG